MDTIQREGAPLGKEASRREKLFLNKVFKESMPFVEQSSMALQSAMGVYSGVRLNDQWTLPWHMPTPAELSDEEIILHEEKGDLMDIDDRMDVQDMTLCDEASFMRPSPAMRKATFSVHRDALTFDGPAHVVPNLYAVKVAAAKRLPSNFRRAPALSAPTRFLNRHLRSNPPADQLAQGHLYRGYPAQKNSIDLAASSTPRSIMRARDVNKALNVPTPSNASAAGNSALSKAREQLKRKFQHLEPVGNGRYQVAMMPENMVQPPMPVRPRQQCTLTRQLQTARPAQQYMMHQTDAAETIFENSKSHIRTRSKNPHIHVRETSPAYSGLCRQPLEITLRNGFKRLRVNPESLYNQTIHRPKTNLPLKHKTLSPKPAFLSSGNNSADKKSLSPISESSDHSYDNQENTLPQKQRPQTPSSSSWHPKLSQILAAHITNPLVLVEQTILTRLRFRRTKDSFLTHPREWSRVEESLLPGTSGTKLRVIRLVLPALHTVAPFTEVPHTDWLILELVNASKTRKARRTPRRAAAPDFGTAESYLVIAFPVPAITKVVDDEEEDGIKVVGGVRCRGVQMRFAGVGMVPLVHGFERDGREINLWLEAFGRGEALLELAYEADEVACWS